MAVKRIVVDGLGRLPQFSHATVAGEIVQVAGTLGTRDMGDDDRLTLVDGGVGPETTQTLHNIERILAGAGVGWDDVTKVNVYLADMADFAAMNAAYGEFFGERPPARITVGGVQLALGARVEIDCVAHGALAHTGGPAARAPAHRPIKRTTGFVEHDGERLYYEVAGEGGVPLVLCHGAGGNHAVWYQQVSAFAQARAVVTWDHRGYGRSTDHADRSGPEVATGDLVAICDNLGIERADVVGQSMGGWTVAGAALERPPLVRSLVLADTLAGFRSPEIDAALAAPRRVPASPADGQVLGQHPAIDAVWAAAHPERAHLYQSLGGMGSADAATMIGRLLSFTRSVDEAARIACPVLCVVGDRDPLFPPAAIGALATALPDARLAELSGCGHSPYFEDPELWNAVVGRFLDEVARGT